MNVSALAAAAVAASLLASAGPAHARPDTRTMSCEQARDFIRQNGAVVMTTGQYTYDRIVANFSHCYRDEEAAIKLAPTADNPRCRVGYYCRQRMREPIFHFGRD